VQDRRTLNERYELQPMPLARGGMGEVWEGRDTTLDREVAVKFVRFPDGVADDEFVRRFMRESRITARLQHPGVPAVFDVGTAEGSPFLVMQRVRGTSVSDLLAQHERLPVAWAAAIAAQTCAVLTVAHQNALVHRDLKPGNLMLEPDGTVKVLDFGLAVALDLTEGSQITRTGQAIGTAAYMAPEQVLAAMSGPRTDLYALGCTLHQMLTGEQVFTGATQYTVMNKQVDQDPPAVRDQRPDVPEGLDTVLRSLLEKEPEERPDSAQDAYEALLPFAADAGELPGAVQPPNVPNPARMYADVLSSAFGAAPAADQRATEPQPAFAADSGPATQPAEPAATREATRRDIETARAQAGGLVRDSRYSEAARLLGGLVDPARDTFSPTDSDVISLRLEWANVLFESGDFRRAAPAYHDLRMDLTDRDGPDTELVFRCRMQYATCHKELGDTDTALPVLQELLADEQRVYGPADPRTIELRRQIGMLQLGSGHREAARETLGALLDDVRAKHGEHHPSVPKIEELLAGIPR